MKTKAKYFKIGDDANNARQLTAFNFSFGDDSSEETGIASVSKESGSQGVSAAWYSLDGVRLDGKPTRKGLYIVTTRPSSSKLGWRSLLQKLNQKILRAMQTTKIQTAALPSLQGAILSLSGQNLQAGGGVRNSFPPKLLRKQKISARCTAVSRNFSYLCTRKRKQNMYRIMNKKKFFAPSAWRLEGAANPLPCRGGAGVGSVTLLRRAATALLLCVMTTMTAWASVPQGYDYIDASGTTHNTAMDGIGENDNLTVINSDEKAAIVGQMLTKVPNAVPTFLITYDLDGGQLPSGQTNPTSYTAESETFTLVNPVRNGYDFAGWTGTGLSSPTQTVTITQGETGIRSYRATWNEASNDISVSSDGNTYTILNATGWGMFCDMLANNASGYFTGKTVKLGADITVTRMAGSEGHEFMGTFDGDGKTLNVNITDTENQGTAPFRFISNATIRNLHVTGSVTGTAHASGLVGKACAGTILIENCLVEANVNSTVGDTKGNKHCGGIVGHGFGGNNPVDLTLRNCVYAGTITCDKNYIGGLQGWSDGNTLTLENCLFAGNYQGTATGTAAFHPIALHNTGSTTSLTATNVFAAVAPTATNANFIAADGTKTTGRTTAPAGLGTQEATYSYMNMTVYQHGLLYNGLYYVAPTLSTDSDNAYLINNEDDWTNFCDALYDNGTWNRFSGQTVKLANDISVSRMAGYDNHDFLGTFDGGGHTLTFTATATDNYLAPFRNVLGNSTTDRAVIRDLNVNTNITAHDHRHTAGLIALVWGYVDVVNCNVTVDITATKGSTNTDLYPAGIASQVVKDAQIAVSGCTVGGTIETDGKYAGGIIGIAQGSASITNSISSVTINSSTDGDGTHGGLVGVQGNYDGSTISITGCVFNGSLLGESTTSCGGFVGWRSKTVNISNSLFAPVQVTINTVDGNTPCATFVRTGDSNITITDCYYTATLGTVQGTQVYSISKGDYVTTLEINGDATQSYDVSGLSFYDTGIKCGDVLYAVENAQLSLTLDHSDREGYDFDGYEFSAGSTNGTTLTMPNADVTVSTKWTIHTYAISYVLNDGTLPADAPESYTIESETFTLPTPTRDGYDFGGWYANSSFSGDPVEATIATGSTGEMTLYAQWTIHTYTISYNLNDGTLPADAPTSYTIESETFTLPTPTREGYRFGGWYDNSSFSGNPVDATIATGSTGDMTLYAKWILLTTLYAANATNDWMTWCSPKEWTIDESQANVYTIGSVADGTVTLSRLTDATVIPAYMPLLIQRKPQVTDEVVATFAHDGDPSNLDAAPYSYTSVDYFESIGTVMAQVSDARFYGNTGTEGLTIADLPGFNADTYTLFALYNGAFLRVGSTTGGFPANRCLLAVKNSALSGAASRLGISIGEPTGIGLTPNPSPTGEGRAAWYSLDGRKLDGKPSRAGVYIYNGKKQVIKK